MLRLALKGLRARKRRAISTMVAVFLGVALMAGGYVFTDTINASFDDIFTEALQGTDVSVTAREVVRQQTGEVPSFDASVLDRVRAVDGVAAAEGSVEGLGQILDRDGDTIGAEFAPKFIFSASSERFDPTTYVEGRGPRTPDEAALDESTADRGNLRLGEQVGVAGEAPAKRYRIVGITRLGETSTGGAAFAALTLPEAQRILNKQGRFDGISVAAAEGVSPEELRDRIDEALPNTLLVETGNQAAERETDQIRSDLSFLTIFLSVFAGVALVVGGFQIFNTFSITVAQRIREFGLLRTLGASRGQVLRSVLSEALLIGVAGAALGVVGGIVFAAAIRELFKAVGADLPSTGTVLLPRTIIVSILVGLAITLLSALSPALRATRVTPMAALLEAELPGSRRRGHLLEALAVLLCLLGVGLTVIGLFGGIEASGTAAGMIGGGAAAVLFGVSLISPRLIRPLASLAGKPMERLRGLTGRLARENAIRKPGRTAATSAALMIGLALVTFVTVFAAGINGSVNAAIDKSYEAQLVIQAPDGFSPIPPDSARAAASVPGVAVVSTLGYSMGNVRGVGDGQRISGVDPSAIAQVIDFEWREGSDATLAGLAERGAIIDEQWGKSNDVDVGDRISVLTPTGRRVTYTARGSVKDNADLIGTFLVSADALRADFGERRPAQAFVKLDPGADVGGVQRRLKDTVEEAFPGTEVLTRDELKDSRERQVSQLVSLVYALLSLAVVISLFGIANTLALSIYERTREIGLLRAVGMTRRQVRRVIRYEAVITALIGAALGMVLGIAFAALLAVPLADEGFTLSYPVVTLFILLALAALAGVFAAIGPARRASRLDVLRAVSYE